MKQDGIATLKALLSIGSTIYPVVMHVSRSGLSRNFKVLILDEQRKELRNISAQVSSVLGLKWNGDGTLSIGGAGMDMGYHLVMRLAEELGFTDPKRETNCYGLNHRNI